VVLNVLKNSIDSFMETDEEKRISVKADVEGEWLIVWVRDSGLGFPAAVADRLFERGFTTKKSAAGTGLYNSRVIMESHGGCIDVSSPGPGRGADARIAFKLSLEPDGVPSGNG
jgi:signal transduction histidine kinase